MSEQKQTVGTMTPEEFQAYNWARQQNFQSVSATYARILANYIKRTDGREQLAGIEPCVWTQQEDGWFEACDGNAFEFTNDGPVENRVKYCYFCGRKIEVKKYEA